MDENEKTPASDENKAVEEQKETEVIKEAETPKKEEIIEQVEEPKQVEESKTEKEVKEEKNEPVTNNNNQNQKTKDNEGKKKHTKLLVASISLIVAVIVAVILFFVFKTKTIDLSKCFSIKYEGYNGHATAYIELNEKALKKEIDDSSVAKSFIKKLEYEVENVEDLSNGDELVIKVKISSSFLKENKLKLKDNTVKIAVTGIEEPISIDMSKYIKVEYTGFNKHATAKVTLDEDKMKEELDYDIYSELRGSITLTVENNENLSNDDEIEVKVNINDYYFERIGINLESDTVKLKVEGLKDAKELDAFKDIKIDLTGMSPNINVSISNNSEDEFLKTVRYKASKTSGIANGETIIITAVEWDEELFYENGVALKETTMEYKVEGQSAYIFNKSEITDSVKAELKTIFTSKATSKSNENYSSYNADNIKWELRTQTDYQYIDADADKDLSFGTPEVMSMYLLTKKDNTNVREINIITAIVKVPCKSAKAGVTYNWYVTIQASNASLKEDGTISDNTEYTINVSGGKDEEKAYETYINAKKNNYNVEKISL